MLVANLAAVLVTAVFEVKVVPAVDGEVAGSWYGVIRVLKRDSRGSRHSDN